MLVRRGDLTKPSVYLLNRKSVAPPWTDISLQTKLEGPKNTLANNKSSLYALCIKSVFFSNLPSLCFLGACV